MGGGGERDDHFDYQGLTTWFVTECSRYGLGSFIWNYDGHDHWGNAWGPVKAANWLGSSGMNWNDIWASSISPSPIGSGCCKWGDQCGDCGIDGSGYCHQSSSNCAACSGNFDWGAQAP